MITDFEIIKLPKKTDVLVIETDQPITGYVRIFDYFKTVNIIEFKSEKDPFRVDTDIPKILVYIGGILLNEKKANSQNMTFTILCSRKPKKLFRMYEKYIQKAKNGLYLIQNLTQVPVYIMCANEIRENLDRETALIKEFSTGNERIRFLKAIIDDGLNGNHRLSEILHFSFSLYKRDIRTIIEREGLSMTIVEKNIREWADELGLKNKYIQEGEDKNKRHVALKMLKNGYSKKR